MSQAIRSAGLAVVLLLAAACASQKTDVADRQGTALQTALVRGRSDLGCPSATALLLSSGLADPTAEADRDRSAERFAYTFGIEGCGTHTTIVVTCERDSSACATTTPGSRTPD